MGEQRVERWGHLRAPGVPRVAPLRVVVAAAQRTIGECAGAGLVLWHGERPTSACTTTELAASLETLQCTAGEGPGLEAIRQLQVFNVDDATCAACWPRFGRLMGERGVRSCLAVPVTVGGRAAGALSLYSYNRDAFTGHEHAGVSLAAEAARAVTGSSSESAAMQATTADLVLSGHVPEREACETMGGTPS